MGSHLNSWPKPARSVLSVGLCDTLADVHSDLTQCKAFKLFQ